MLCDRMYFVSSIQGKQHETLVHVDAEQFLGRFGRKKPFYDYLGLPSTTTRRHVPPTDLDIHDFRNFTWPSFVHVAMVHPMYPNSIRCVGIGARTTGIHLGWVGNVR